MRHVYFARPALREHRDAPVRRNVLDCLRSVRGLARQHPRRDCLPGPCCTELRLDRGQQQAARVH